MPKNVVNKMFSLIIYDDLIVFSTYQHMSLPYSWIFNHEKSEVFKVFQLSLKFLLSFQIDEQTLTAVQSWIAINLSARL